MLVGGWVTLPEWQHQVVPWLLKQVEPKASGGWWVTHVVEIRREIVTRTAGGTSL
jgi:hypothetical protein